MKVCLRIMSVNESSNDVQGVVVRQDKQWEERRNETLYSWLSCSSADLLFPRQSNRHVPSPQDALKQPCSSFPE